MDPRLQSVYQRFLECGGVADLRSRVKLAVTGPDRVRYLNGQVTSNVAKLTTGACQRACVTTAKGRLCAEILITHAGDRLLVDADAAVAETLSPRLERYIVSDDVTVEDVSDSPLLHVIGKDPANLLPEGNGALTVRSNRFGIEGWDIWPCRSAATGNSMPAIAESLESLLGALTRELPVLDDALLEVIRIERGVPRWGFELGEDTLPPEAGLDLTHIDYHKGCYIGQEVISRLKSVGHVNRSLTGFVGAGSGLAPGTDLYSPEAPAKPVGRITSVTWSFALEKPIALGYLKRGIVGTGLTAGTDNATPVDIHPLPFVS